MIIATAKYFFSCSLPLRAADSVVKPLRCAASPAFYALSAALWQIQGLNAGHKDPIIERIGSYPSGLWFGSSILPLLIEGTSSTLRCYRDDDLYFEGNTLGIPCDSVLDVTAPEKIKFSVRPNPFMDEIRLSIPPSVDEFLQFRLLDLTGKMVLQKPVRSGVNIITTTELPNAFYFWEIRQGIAVLGSGRVVKN